MKIIALIIFTQFTAIYAIYSFAVARPNDNSTFATNENSTTPEPDINATCTYEALNGEIFRQNKVNATMIDNASAQQDQRVDYSREKKETQETDATSELEEQGSSDTNNVREVRRCVQTFRPLFVYRQEQEERRKNDQSRKLALERRKLDAKRRQLNQYNINNTYTTFEWFLRSCAIIVVIMNSLKFL